MRKLDIKSPVVVVGVPRSGTSFVVECLMKHYGVRMCLNEFTTENDYILDDNETYEDSIVVDLNMKLTDGRLTMEEYQKEMKKFFAAMEMREGPWGFKDPRLLHGLKWVIEHFDGKLTIIRTIREPSLVINSMVKVLGWPQMEAIKRFNERNLIIDTSLRYKNMAVLHCRFGEKRRTEEEFCETFEKALASKLKREAEALEFFKRKQARRKAVEK